MKKLLLLLGVVFMMYCVGCQKHEPENQTFTMNKPDTSVVVKPPIGDTIPIIPPGDTIPVGTACDTTNITFALTIKTIFNQHCVSCHNGDDDDDDDDDHKVNDEDALITYSDITEAIDDEGVTKFMKMINHTGGHYMPPSYKMTDCEIAKIRLWIAAGMPNN